MKKDRAYDKRPAGEVVVLVTISLVLGVALQQIMDDRPPPNQPDMRHARGHPTPSPPTTGAPLNAEPHLAPKSPAAEHTPGSSSIPDRPFFATHLDHALTSLVKPKKEKE